MIKTRKWRQFWIFFIVFRKGNLPYLESKFNKVFYPLILINVNLIFSSDLKYFNSKRRCMYDFLPFQGEGGDFPLTFFKFMCWKIKSNEFKGQCFNQVVMLQLFYSTPQHLKFNKEILFFSKNFIFLWFLKNSRFVIFFWGDSDPRGLLQN